MRRNPIPASKVGVNSHSEAPGGSQSAASLLTLALNRLPGTKCLCGKCKTCQNRRYSAEWRKRHPGPKQLTRVRKPGIGTGKTAESKTSWRNKQLNSMEKAIAASRNANHQPERFADWSKRRIEELRASFASIRI